MVKPLPIPDGPGVDTVVTPNPGTVAHTKRLLNAHGIERRGRGLLKVDFDWAKKNPVEDRPTEGEENYVADASDREWVLNQTLEPNCVTSLVERDLPIAGDPQAMHYPIIDFDKEIVDFDKVGAAFEEVGLPIEHCQIIASTTANHRHLYFDWAMRWDDFADILPKLEAIGVEPGYIKASLRRGFTSLRLPWEEKDENILEFPRLHPKVRQAIPWGAFRVPEGYVFSAGDWKTMPINKKPVDIGTGAQGKFAPPGRSFHQTTSVYYKSLTTKPTSFKLKDITP
jgi:hypothetical protein